MRLVAGALLCLAAAACAKPESSAMRYQRWLDAGHRDQVSAYEAYLRAGGLDRVVPMPELLRSGRRWQHCKASEFAVPPREEWQAMTATLQLVGRLRTAGILGRTQVVSAWRSPAFNRCEGGSSRSRHLRNNALDFDIAGGTNVEALCAYWRRHGAGRRFGLGFYSPGRIHVDTSGFRTWGRNYRRDSSLCVRGTSSSQ
jgi:hypothetical protein